LAPIVGRAGGLAGRQQSLDLGCRSRLLAEQPLCLFDVTNPAGRWRDRDQAAGDRRHERLEARICHIIEQAGSIVRL
jgi:hypothetical protein